MVREEYSMCTSQHSSTRLNHSHTLYIFNLLELFVYFENSICDVVLIHFFESCQVFEVVLQREYTEHYLCKQVFEMFILFSTVILFDTKYYAQIRTLQEVESLKDVTVRFGSVL